MNVLKKISILFVSLMLITACDGANDGSDSGSDPNTPINPDPATPAVSSQWDKLKWDNDKWQ